MSSAIGTLASLNANQADGPLFLDKITMVGDAAYPTGGTLSFEAALRALRGDNRTVLRVAGFAGTIGYSVRYTPPVYNNDGTATTPPTVATHDKLQVFFEDQTSGVVAEVGNGTNLSALTFTLEVTSN